MLVPHAGKSHFASANLIYLCSAFLVCDRIGRIWATRQLCILWIIGIAIFMGNGGSLGAVYAGRFIAGLGVGQTVVVGPVYLAEIVSFFFLFVFAFFS